MTKTPIKIKKKSLKQKGKENLPARPLKLWQDITNHQEVRIDILPMIDVIFCILTFFILAAVGFSRQQAISLDLPKATTGTAQMRDMLVVSLDDQGQLFLEKNPVTQVQLYSAVKNYHNLNPTGLMVLHASKNITYEKVIEVLDLLKEVGGDQVALATLPGNSPAPNETVNPYSGFNPYYNPYSPNQGYYNNVPNPNLPRLPSQPPTPPKN